MSNSLYEGTDSSESDGEYDLEVDPVVDMRILNGVDAPDGIHSDGHLDMEWDGDDEEEVDEMEEEVVDEDQ